MRKFKPKAILLRVLLGESWQKEDGLDYLYAGFDRNLLGSTHDDDDDDGRSIISISTNATADDLPGTGRMIDTHVFQPLGRRIERLAMRFTIASLHPARIAQYMQVDIGVYYSFDDSMTLKGAIAELCSWSWNGSTIVAGLKGLVKQTQSNSIHRSASALSALIRVSLGYLYREIYANISLIEPIFHLETLAGSLDDSHPEKKWLLFLVKFARETVIAIRAPSPQESFDPFLRKEVLQLWPSPEAALNLRQRLIRLLEVYRLSGLDSLDVTIGEAFAICAEAVSAYIDMYARGDAYMHIMETVYFAVIFILRSIYELADFARITANRHIYMVLRTLACWLDAIVYRCQDGYRNFRGRFNMDRLKIYLAFRGIILVDDSTLLPESFKNARWEVLDKDALPRRHREATEWGEDTPPIQRLIGAAKQRTLLLLRSFDELEREVWGCASRTNISTSHLEIVAHSQWFSAWDFGDEWWEHWKSTLERARKVQVSEITLTEEFREARRLGLEDGTKYMYESWAAYQVHRLMRHKWGQYFRSEMDWDWDLGTCMRRLFTSEQTREGHPLAARSSPVTYSKIGANAEQGTTWRLQAQGSLPKLVQIAYETENGETQYMSFVPAFSGAGRCPLSESSSIGSLIEESLNPNSNMMVVQEDSESRKGVSSGEQVTEDAGSAYSDDDEQFVDCESVLSEEIGVDLEGGHVTYDAGFEEAQG